MKKIFSLFASLLALGAAAQTSLPTTWSFTTTTYPFGWTNFGTSFYTGSGNTPPACRLDNTSDWVQIHFSGSAGPLSYYITGNSFAGGSFDVEESVNGTTWTQLRHFDQNNLPSTSYQQFTDQPNSASRYVRFYYTQKQSGNVGLDDVNLAVPPAGPQQEINVQQNSSSVITGGTIFVQSPVSTTTPFTLDVQNLGTANTLNISSVVVSGVDAADFTVQSFPSTVSALSVGTISIDFTPAAAGTRNATITISSDDSDEPAYIVNVYGIGGSFATEPATQPTNMQFANIRSYRFTGSFTAANPQPEGYLVLRRDGAAVTDIPTDGTSYQRGDVIGSSKVVFSGSMTAFAPLYIAASSTYHFAVFSYNGPAQYRNYLQAAPLTGNVTTTGSMQPGNFYSTISTGSTSFVGDLTALINPHTDNFYSNYGPRMVSLFWARDTTGDQRVITCVYSGEQHVYTEPYAWTIFSREHTYCHSWMDSYPSSNGPEYSDYYNLFPTNQNDVNAVRSNYPLGEVVNASYTYLDCKYGLDANGKTVFEPRDEQKGDAARALFYMATCYNTQSANWGFPNPISTSIPYGQDQNILKAWHYMDPPDAREIARNDFIDSLQGNRNPFIDSMHYACFIDFRNMSYVSGPSVPCSNSTIGMAENKTGTQLALWPNPSEGNSTLYYKSENAEALIIRVLDLAGRTVYEQRANVSAGANAFALDLQQLAKGAYTLQVQTAQRVLTEKMVVK